VAGRGTMTLRVIPDLGSDSDSADASISAAR
jgi:hypothetical protein